MYCLYECFLGACPNKSTHNLSHKQMSDSEISQSGCMSMRAGQQPKLSCRRFRARCDVIIGSSKSKRKKHGGKAVKARCLIKMFVL